MILPLLSYDKSVKSVKMSSLVFIWIGFLLAISFMESWLKFRAPGVTMEVGLSVGNLVFNALNKVELTLIFLLILFSLFSASKPIYKEVSFLIPMLIVLIQTVVLLPQMDQRVLLLLNKEMLPPSNLHFYYVGGEVLKLTSLSVLGIRLIK